jgi:glycosyltransferase involved in cell wall biosynthesis
MSGLAWPRGLVRWRRGARRSEDASEGAGRRTAGVEQAAAAAVKPSTGAPAESAAPGAPAAPAMRVSAVPSTTPVTAAPPAPTAAVSAAAAAIPLGSASTAGASTTARPATAATTASARTSAPAATPTRVLIVAEHASARFGGEAVLALHYFRVLRRRGLDAWLVVHERTREELERLFPDAGERIRYVPDTPAHIALWRLGQRLPDRLSAFTTGYAMRLLTQRAQLREVRALVAEHGIEVVHQPMPVSPKEPSLLRAVGAPVVIGPMNGGMTYPPGFADRQGRLTRWVIEAGRAGADLANRLAPGKPEAALLLVANERTRRALPLGLGARARLLVENGVDLSLWQPRPAHAAPRTGSAPPVRFTFVGRLVDLKAVDCLIDAFVQARGHAPMSLSVIGDGEQRAALEAQARRHDALAGAAGEAGRVHFAGWMTQAECAARLREADALVLPSLHECGGAVVLEAMAVGLPVIASAWGGPLDYLDAECGVLVPVESREGFVAGLADALARLAGDAALRERMGEVGRRRVAEEFDWEVKVDRMLGLYAEAMHSFAHPPGGGAAA